MGSIVREKAWITKTSSSLHKDGKHNVIVCEKYLGNWIYFLKTPINIIVGFTKFYITYLFQSKFIFLHKY